MSEPIVLFGGTFDPVHNGHLITVRSVAEQCGFGRVHLVPAAVRPHKAGAHATATQRLRMLQLAVEADELFEICELELSRPGPSYTVDTVRQLRGQGEGDEPVCLIVGADMLAELPTWHGVDELLREARIVVALRPPWDRQIRQILDELQKRLGSQSVRGLEENLVRTPLIEISSSDIRERLRRGLPIRYMVPEAVERYILSEAVYGG